MLLSRSRSSFTHLRSRPAVCLAVVLCLGSGPPVLAQARLVAKTGLHETFDDNKRSWPNVGPQPIQGSGFTYYHRVKCTA